MTPEQFETMHLVQAAYSAGMLDAAELVTKGMTPGELQRAAEDQSQAYALSVMGGTV
jgi:hypothetical protein